MPLLLFVLADAVLVSMLKSSEVLDKRNLRIHRPVIVVAQILAVKVVKILRHIHIAVQVDIAVARMIIAAVETKKLLIGKLRNVLRTAARTVPIGVPRVKCRRQFLIKLVLGIREAALHLAVHDAVDCNRVVLLLEMITPAFLTEYQFIAINVRVEYRVNVNVHQVPKVLIVAARNRIDGLVGIGDRI